MEGMSPQHSPLGLVSAFPSELNHGGSPAACCPPPPRDLTQVSRGLTLSEHRPPDGLSRNKKST